MSKVVQEFSKCLFFDSGVVAIEKLGNFQLVEKCALPF